MNEADNGATRFPVDMREGIIWAYRLLLEREPNNEQAVMFHEAEHYSVSTLRTAFRECAEYRAAHSTTALLAASAAVIARFEPFCDKPAPTGSWHDFLGVRTRCSFLPDAYMAISGIVQGPPGSANGPIHDLPEWIGTLQSVLEAQSQMTVVELGAGWAPWLVASANAAARIGIHDVRLIGVEGSSGHVAYMRQHFIDNGVDPDAHALHHAVVGSYDGIAHFPKLLEPNNTYGSQASDASDDSPDMEDVSCITLQTLLEPVLRVDLLHCDIQGAEAAVFRHGQEIVDKRVHRLVIGTHSRDVEADLLNLFGSLGWVLEAESVCQLVQTKDGMFSLAVDGTQVWRNPKI